MMSQTNPTEIAKQFSLIAGSLTFLGFFLPQLFEGIPPIENLLLAAIAAAVMSILGWKFGLIWGEPLQERHVRSNLSLESTRNQSATSADPPALQGVSTASTVSNRNPATSPSDSGATVPQTDVVSDSISPEEATSQSWEVNGTGETNAEQSANREA